MEVTSSTATAKASANLSKIASKFNKDKFKTLHEEMSFSDYMEAVYQRPKLVRTAYQYLYDMIIQEGSEQVELYRKSYTKYNFFSDPSIPIFGLLKPLHELVQFFRGAAGGYGPEKRFLLLHGPVGSSKSTILRRIKRGLEDYSVTDDGAWYTFKWVNLPTGEDGLYTQTEDESPMREDPLKLIPEYIRKTVIGELNDLLLESLSEEERNSHYRLRSSGDLDPRSKKFMEELLIKYDGDWEKVVTEHIRVVRKVHSEADRVAIATFQPKDEKNQDSTELTGDINWGKLPHFGTDSDPRAFNFDGEFCVGNRGVVEFIEVLKLAKEFLYDLLGASQEQSIKPKKFAQVGVDTVLIGHSVSGHEPIVCRLDGFVFWTTLEELYDNFSDNVSGLEVLSHDFDNDETKWTKVQEITRHKWNGSLITTRQKWGEVETTPNHALYNQEGNLFVPEDVNDVMSVRKVDNLTSIDRIVLNEIVPKGFICNQEESKLLGHTKQPSENCVRSVKQRASTSVINILEGESLSSFVEFLCFYAAEGHTTDTGVVLSQKDRSVLESLRESVSNFCDSEGHIQYVEKDGCHRLIYNSYIMRDLAEIFCGKNSEFKKLPDFLFNLDKSHLEVAFETLKLTDGSACSFEGCSQDYIDNSCDYKTVSRMLAAQVGYLFTLLNKDYSLRYGTTKTDKKSFGIRTVLGNRKKESNNIIAHRDSMNEWVYDVGCEGIHNFACGVGLLIAHNTNNPEYEKLKEDVTMEALRDRTVKIDIPYLLSWSDELNVLEHYYGPEKVRQHIAPHTLEIAALWSVLTRLQDDKDNKVSLVEKAKLYDGRKLDGYTVDTVKEMRDKYPNEGMQGGVSCRYVQDKVSNCLSSHFDYINPFMVMNEIKAGIENQSLFSNEEDKARYVTCVDAAIKELDEILKNEVQKALVGDEDAIVRLCQQYIDNLMAYIEKTKIKDPFTGQDREPDERLMRSIEEKIDIPEAGADQFRTMIQGFIGKLYHNNEEFSWKSNEKLKKALQLKLYEDTKDHIKLSALNVKGATVVDKDIQDKIDAIKQRLITQYGYNEQSATDVLDYVGSIFARGDVADNDN